jgi:hypothetical protein
MINVANEIHATRRDVVDVIFSERLNAIDEMPRRGGFAPSQQALDRLIRALAGLDDERGFADIGAIRGHVDAPALQSKCGHGAISGCSLALWF